MELSLSKVFRFLKRAFALKIRLTQLHLTLAVRALAALVHDPPTSCRNLDTTWRRVDSRVCALITKAMLTYALILPRHEAACLRMILVETDSAHCQLAKIECPLIRRLQLHCCRNSGCHL